MKVIFAGPAVLLHTWRKRLKELLFLFRKRDLRALLAKIAVRLGVRNFYLLSSLSPLPVELMIEPVNVCNLACPTCPTGTGRLNRPPRAMTLAEFRRIINQVRGRVCRVFLWNYGEPFLNKELTAMVRYAAAAGIPSRVSTNGEFLFSLDVCREVVESGLEHLIVCLDGADQETHKKFRRKSDFSAVVNGIKLMVQARRALNSASPLIELQFLVMRHNEGQGEEMWRLSKELGADIYSEKTIGIDSNDPSFHALASELLPEDLSRSVYYRKPDSSFALKGGISNGCSRLYSSAVINSDGSVVPCCYDVDSSHVMGNVFEQSLADIWAGEKYMELRRRVRNNKKSVPMCNMCLAGRSDLYVRRAGRWI